MERSIVDHLGKDLADVSTLQVAEEWAAMSRCDESKVSPTTAAVVLTAAAAAALLCWLCFPDSGAGWIPGGCTDNIGSDFSRIPSISLSRGPKHEKKSNNTAAYRAPQTAAAAAAQIKI